MVTAGQFNPTYNIGSGPDPLAVKLAGKASDTQVTGLDVSPAMVEMAKRVGLPGCYHAPS